MEGKNANQTNQEIKMSIATATIENGNKTINVSVSAGSDWNKEGNHRTYFDVSHSDRKRVVIDKLYEVVSGSTRDESVEVSGRVFAFSLGVCVDSKTKKQNAVEAIEQIAAQIVNA